MIDSSPSTTRLRRLLQFPSVVAAILALAVAASATANPQEAGQPAESPKNPLPPMAARQFAEALLTNEPAKSAIIDSALDRARAEATPGEYSWLDSFLYCSAVHAAAAGDEKRAKGFLKEYLGLVGPKNSSLSIPSVILTDALLRHMRAVTATRRESLLKRWGDERWSLHSFKTDQVGWEYESALSLLCVLSEKGELGGILVKEKASSAGVEASCVAATWDTRRLFAALRYRQLGLNSQFTALLRELRDSEARTPAPEDLLARIERPPILVLGLRARAIAMLSILVIVFLATVVALRRSRCKRCPAGTDADRHRERDFAIHGSSPIAWVFMDWLGIGPLATSFVTFAFFGAGLTLMAWSEGSLWPRGFVVDRSFFDYLSFPYGFGLMIPAFFCLTFVLYRTVAAKFSDVLSSSVAARKGGKIDDGVPDPVKELWSSFSAFCNSRFLTLGCIAASAVIAVMQRRQWSADPGTAFVDFKYPGHWSLTGFYFLLVSLILFYAILSGLSRAVAVLVFVGRAYGRKWRSDHGIEIRLDAAHLDRCAGLKVLGWTMLICYALFLLLAAQVLLNMAEKLRFYESMEIVLSHTFVSVVIFGSVFLLVVPVVVGLPLVSVHMAMREYRITEGARLAKIGNAFKADILNKIERRSGEKLNLDELNATQLMQEELKKMPLWPLDFKVGFIFVASHLLPIISFLFPVIEQRIAQALGLG